MSWQSDVDADITVILPGRADRIVSVGRAIHDVAVTGETPSGKDLALRVVSAAITGKVKGP